MKTQFAMETEVLYATTKLSSLRVDATIIRSFRTVDVCLTRQPGSGQTLVMHAKMPGTLTTVIAIQHPKLYISQLLLSTNPQIVIVKPQLLLPINHAYRYPSTTRSY